ncbi:uncharacterized protein [Clytia hemisphaerica]
MAVEISSTTVVKGANKHCCWGICKHDSRYPDRLPPGTFFISFPKVGKLKDSQTEWQKGKERGKTEKAKRWIHACGRKGFTISNITKSTYICSKHFIGGNGPTEENPDPIKATLSEAEVEKKLSGKRKAPKQREPLPSKPVAVKRKKESNIEVTFECNTANEPLDSTEAGPSTSSNQNEENQKQTLIISVDAYCSTDVVNPPDTVDKSTQTEADKLAKSTQTEADKLAISGRIEIVTLKNEIAVLKSRIESSNDHSECNPMSMNVILKSEEKTKYFIGLSRKHFWSLYNFLGDAKFNLTYWNSSYSRNSSTRKFSIPIPNQLFITLLRLRRGFNLYTMAHFYSVSETTISTIFNTWIMFLFHHFKSLGNDILFPERQVFKKTLPKVFRPFKNVRASIDCTELKCEAPRDYKRQGNMYSNYKSHCTFKCLIAVNPNGAACFVSDLFEGSINDVDIFQKCGILQQVNFQDSFLVDKGFTVQHLLLPKQASIFIPPFLGKRERFTKEEVLLCKRIAKARIHVERFNERLKRFRLLDGIIQLSLTPIASQLVFVGSMLVNFQHFLCK